MSFFYDDSSSLVPSHNSVYRLFFFNCNSRSEEAQSTMTSLHGDTPAPTTTAATPRAVSVNLQESYKKSFPRIFCIEIPDEDDYPFWPCLYFRNYDNMLEELGAFVDQETKGSDDDPLLTQDDLTKISLSYIPESEKIQADEDGSKIPLVVVLGLNRIVMKPRETDMRQLANGVTQLMELAKNDPFIDKVMKKFYKFYDVTAPRRRKRGAGVFVRPAVSETVAATGTLMVEQTPVSKSTPASTQPVALLEATAPMVAAASAAAATTTPAATTINTSTHNYDISSPGMIGSISIRGKGPCKVSNGKCGYIIL